MTRRPDCRSAHHKGAPTPANVKVTYAVDHARIPVCDSCSEKLNQFPGLIIRTTRYWGDR